jgi:hypothetical protein
MTVHADGTHYSRTELEAYFDGGLTAARETQIEEHLAVCDACTTLSREVFAASGVLENWTARAHGEAYVREALGAALERAEARESPLRDRIVRWRTDWAGLAEAAIRLVVDAPRAASQLATAQVTALVRPGATLQLAPAGIPRTRGAIRVRGAVRTRGAAGSGRQQGSDVAPVLDVRRDGDAVLVRLANLGPAARVPVVMLVSLDRPGEYQSQEAARTPSGIHVARFNKPGHGSYLVVVEPFTSAS